MEMQGCRVVLFTAFVGVALLYSPVTGVSLGHKTFNVGKTTIRTQGLEFDVGENVPPYMKRHLKCDLNSNFTRHCGVRPLVNSKFYTTDETAYGEFPHHVALIRSSDMKFLCSGALLDDLHVITAAQCVADVPKHDIVIRMGEWDILNDNNLQEVYFSIERMCARVFIHPQYRHTDPEGNHGHDVAILRMDRGVDFDLSPSVAPICLPEPYPWDRKGTFPARHFNKDVECYVAGWGDSPVLVLEAEYYRHFMIAEEYYDKKRRRRSVASDVHSDVMSDAPDYDVEDFTDLDIDAVNAASHGIQGVRRAAQGPAAGVSAGPIFDGANSDLFDDDFGYFDDDFGMCDVDLEDLILQRVLRTNGFDFPTPADSVAIRNALRRKFRRRLVKRSQNARAKRDYDDVYEFSRILNKGKVQILNANECRDAHHIVGHEFKDELCITSKIERNLCKADIGSPVVCISKGKAHSRHTRDTLVLDSPGHDFRAAPLRVKGGPVKKMFIAGVVSDNSCVQSSAHVKPAATATSIISVLDFICDVLSAGHFHHTY